MQSHGARNANYILAGIIELDDGYMGGPRRSGNRGRCTDKPKIVIALSKTENDTLFTRMKVVDDLKTKTLQDFTNIFLRNGTHIECGSYHSYLGSTGVNCTSMKYDAVNGDLKWLHRAISNFWGVLNGTYHGRYAQLQTYLDELFSRLVRAVATSCALLS